MGFKESAAKFGGKFLNKCVQNNGMFLFATAAAGYVLASIAQTVGLVVNKKISNEEKKFLIPQELFDGASNILTYAAICLPLMKGAKTLATKHFPNNPKAIEGANTLAVIAGGVVASNVVTPFIRNKASIKVKNMLEKKPATRTMPDFKEYMDTAKNFSGGGVSRI